MKKDIILCGVGGQGILSIATIIGEAATKANINLKQAEVHGMSQRGGDVQSNLRLSTDTIYSDLIPQGGADVIISMEPMEALRYLPYLAKDGVIVTSNKPFVNIPNYPEEQALFDELNALPNKVVRLWQRMPVRHARPMWCCWVWRRNILRFCPLRLFVMPSPLSLPARARLWWRPTSRRLTWVESPQINAEINYYRIITDLYRFGIYLGTD